jgi:protein SCO1/2
VSTEFTPASKRRKFIVLFILIGIVPIGLLFMRTGKHTFVKLPYYGPKEVNGPGDTLFHQVPPFSFIDQDSNIVSDKTTADKILVVDFFFTSCKSICPRMSKEMQQLQFKLSDKVLGDVLFLSHTVDPEHDTPAVLKEYARKLQADTSRWKFVTGDANTIYRQGNLGYLLSAMEDTANPERFVHSPNFILVDKRRNIRGIYEGTRTSSVDSLVTDVKMLVGEERHRARLAREAAEGKH